MKLTFLGAAERVTGSSYLLEFDNMKMLVDCGMFQGGKAEDAMNHNGFNFNPADIDYVLLTHAHIDHSGRIPMLVKQGFKGKILCSKPTQQLCEIMLPDSGFIQESEIEWVNVKRQRAGKPLLEPLYTVDDAKSSLEFFTGVDYNEVIPINNNVNVRFRNAGHILGSAMIEMWISEKGDEFKIVFSGDVGNTDVPIMPNPTIIEDADYVICESTYGNRLHKDMKNKGLLLLDIITDTIERKGNVVIPSFAIERTQEILYEINMLKDSKGYQQLKDIPVYLDSPLAINATRIFENNVEHLNEEAASFIKNGDNPFDFPNLIYTETADESKAINFYNGSSIIISASGMCEAGRIKHHLKHNLWREECSVVFVGYQAKETLGRRIIEGEKLVKIFGEEISVKCKVYSIEGFSGHADQAGLMNWIGGFKKKPQKIFLVHGEDEALTTFSDLISKTYGIDNQIAKMNQTIELISKSQSRVVVERYDAHKDKLAFYMESVKSKLSGTFERLKTYVDVNDNTKLDALNYMVENIESKIDELDKEITKK